MVSEARPRVAALVVADQVDRPFFSDLDVYDLGACGILWKPHSMDRTIGLIQVAAEAAAERAALHLQPA
jgi:hypothetical protein